MRSLYALFAEPHLPAAPRELPWAVARKYANASRSWPWQRVFPATRFYVDRAIARGVATICTRQPCSGP